jgi:hypothetical protein
MTTIMKETQSLEILSLGRDRQLGVVGQHLDERLLHAEL